MIVLSLLIAAASQVAAPPPPQAPAERDIVVTGRRLEDTEKAWKDCVARRCPPDKEIAAALTHAENLFVAGDYSRARQTLRSTIGRVDGRAADYPVEVAGIWRAESRISAHLGWAPSARISGFASVDALKKGLPDGDARILVQRIENADTFARQAEWQKAKNLYIDVEKEAKRRNLPTVRGYAMLRRALLYAVIGEVSPEFKVGMQRIVRDIVATSEPDLAPFRDAARLLEAQSEAMSGDTGKIDALVANYSGEPTVRPRLLYTPAYDLPGVPPVGQARIRGTTGPTSQGIMFEDQWADLTFLIGRDGRVSDVDVLRESPKLTGKWLEPVVEAVGKRRYAPLAVPEGEPGMRRVERFTMTADRETGTTGSNLTNRGIPKIVTLDLTVEPDARTAAALPARGG